MRTTLNLNEEIILQVMSFTEMKNKSQAVNKVLEEYVRKKKKQALLKMKGTLHLEDNWKQIRKMEVDEK
ncbi:MAG: type II toxin-antitoxin system VapB family antitoxin [Deltaproteobacteria bacterium]|jgi:Arc/MetJ family transcription regulator|nr:type II toxin-antitoxin system VapB family antitoxin [Deltaproteobacteria bacterium]